MKNRIKFSLIVLAVICCENLLSQENANPPKVEITNYSDENLKMDWLDIDPVKFNKMAFFQVNSVEDKNFVYTLESTMSHRAYALLKLDKKKSLPPVRVEINIPEEPNDLVMSKQLFLIKDQLVFFYATRNTAGGDKRKGYMRKVKPDLTWDGKEVLIEDLSVRDFKEYAGFYPVLSEEGDKIVLLTFSEEGETHSIRVKVIDHTLSVISKEEIPVPYKKLTKRGKFNDSKLYGLYGYQKFSGNVLYLFSYNMLSSESKDPEPEDFILTYNFDTKKVSKIELNFNGSKFNYINFVKNGQNEIVAYGLFTSGKANNKNFYTTGEIKDHIITGAFALTIEKDGSKEAKRTSREFDGKYLNYSDPNVYVYEDGSLALSMEKIGSSSAYNDKERETYYWYSYDDLLIFNLSFKGTGTDLWLKKIAKSHYTSSDKHKALVTEGKYYRFKNEDIFWECSYTYLKGPKEPIFLMNCSFNFKEGLIKENEFDLGSLLNDVAATYVFRISANGEIQSTDFSKKFGDAKPVLLVNSKEIISGGRLVSTFCTDNGNGKYKIGILSFN